MSVDLEKILRPVDNAAPAFEPKYMTLASGDNLVIRQADERSGEETICWMNVTQYLKGRKNKKSRQIVFEGEELEIAVACDPNAKFHVLASKSGAEAAVYLMEVVC